MLKRWYAGLLVIAVCAVAGAVYYSVESSGATDVAVTYGDEPRVLDSKFYFEKQFTRSVESAATNDAVFPQSRIRGGIIPHDVTQGQIIAHFFRELEKNPPKRIILVGPNHYERGGSMVLTTSTSWRSGAGTIHADRDAVRWLVDNHYAVEDDEVAVDEHSIAGITPYISNYLPEARVIPLMLKAEVRLNEIQSISRALDELVDDETVVIAAVDFSHYLTADEASRNDIVTEQALQTFDYKNMLSFGPRFNDYMDSPGSIALLLYWLTSQGITKYELIEHTNSGILTGDMTSPVTSYFEVVYY